MSERHTTLGAGQPLTLTNSAARSKKRLMSLGGKCANWGSDSRATNAAAMRATTCSRGCTTLNGPPAGSSLLFSKRQTFVMGTK